MPRAQRVLLEAPTGRQLLRWVVHALRLPLAAGIAAGIGWQLSLAVLPIALGRALDGGVAGGDLRLAALGALLIACVVAAEAVTGVVRHWFATRLYADAQRLVTEAVADRLADGARPAPGRASGVLLSHVDHDAGRIGAAVDVLCRGAGAVLSTAVVAAWFITTAPSLGLVVLVGVPAVMAATVPLFRPLARRSAEHQERLADASAHAADVVAGLRTARALGTTPVLAQRFDERGRQVERSAVAVAVVEAAYEALRVGGPGLLLAALVLVGGGQVGAGVLTPGELITAFGLATYLVVPLATFAEMGTKWASASAAARRVAATLSRTARVDELPRRDDAGPTRDTGLEVQGLVLPSGAELHLDAAPGEVVGVVADHDDVEALLRSLRGGHASVAVGGAATDRLPPTRRRTALLVAEQAAFLFAGTLRENLCLAGDRSDVEVAAAVATAALDDVVALLGMDGEVTARGRSLSGGQRQRVALARALLADPPVLVLEEPTSAVDAHTEAAIADRLRSARTVGATVLLTHSPALLGVADRTVWVQAGTASVATHAELLEVAAYRNTVAPAEWAVSA